VCFGVQLSEISGILNNRKTMFRKLYLFPSSGKERETPTVGSLRKKPATWRNIPGDGILQDLLKLARQQINTRFFKGKKNKLTEISPSRSRL
jgi:hypothetical protein